MILLGAALALASPWKTARDELSGEHVSLQGLLRGRADLEAVPESQDVQGVRWQAARALLRVDGPQHLSLFVVGEAANQVRLLDAWAQWKPSERFYVRLGKFRPDASPEMLTPIQVLPFVDRSLAVRRLAPVWDWGVTLGGRAGWFAWSVGAFESGWLKQDGSLPLGCVRIGLENGDEDTHWYVRIASFASKDTDATWLGGSFAGRRLIGVVAGGLKHERLDISTEILGGLFDPEVARTGYPIGGHVTVEVQTSRHGKLGLRAAGFGRRWTPAAEYVLFAGATLWPWPDARPPVELKLNLGVPLHRRSAGDIVAQGSLQLWL